ncbi:MAG TPA: dihydrodipicolinate synthase family protein [Gemmatimonadaceae bacterium]|nr:dihydrodipicolinate synthase family protein [Gemmatimonadaceae bacterium]
MRDLGGVLGPVTTPFDGRGELARAAFEGNVRTHLEDGLAGILVAGSTGEAALLDEDERATLIVWARPLVPDDRWLIAGTGAESTRQCVLRCRVAAERGADAVLVVAPHYYGSAMTEAALGAHFRRVADESPLPVMLYNIPKYAHFALTPALVMDLAAHENVIGIKDSSGDLALLEQYLEAQGPRFTVLTGNGGTFAGALARGSRGGILAVALFAAPLTMAVLERHDAGDAAGAARAQEPLIPLAARIVGALGVAGVKAALDVAGYAGGPVRSPLLPLEPSQRDEVAALMERSRGTLTV